MATDSRIVLKRLKMSSARLLPVALIASLISFIPTVLVPGSLSPAKAAGPYSITYSPGTYTTASGEVAATGTQSNGPTSIAGTGSAEGTCWFSAPSPTYTVPAGYSFLYWAKSGTTPTFVVGTRVPTGSSCIGNPFNLTAKWAANKYVFRQLNRSETATATYAGVPLTARIDGLATPNNLSSWGFGGWCTVENSLNQPCTGTTYAAGSTLPTPTLSSVSLWAIWKENTITWDEKFPPYDGENWESQFNGAETYTAGSAIGKGMPTDNPHTEFYDFDGWWTATTGGTQVTETFVPPSPYGPVTFFGHWKPKVVEIVWDNNEGLVGCTGGSPTYLAGSSVATIPTSDPAYEGYTFAGWFTERTGGVQVTNGSYTPPAPYDKVTFFAHWTAIQGNAQNYSITWNDQDATRPSSGGSSTYASSSSIPNIPTTAPQKTGYTFVGWFTGATSGSQLTNGSYTPASPYGSRTFYAHWTLNKSNSAGTWAWTNRSSAGSANWHALATSADGAKLFAGVDGGGSLYRSTDFGVTWSPITGTSGHNWFSIASNIDGTKVVAVDHGGDIWTSTDSGSTWTQRSVGAVRDWECIASSSDGVKLVAVASNGSNNGFIYTSTDSGATWSSNLAPAGTNKFTGVTSSDDGNKLAVTSWANGIYTSSNSGQTWTARTLPVPNAGSATYLQAVASSGDGSHLLTGSRRAGGSNGGVIFTSSDYGATWKAFAQTQYDYINFVSNGDGSRLAATIYGQQGVSTSGDFGATWAFQSLGSSGVIPLASNIDGSLLFVAGYGGNLWTGKVPNSHVVAVLPASTSASISAATNAPATILTFSASGSSSGVTVTPIANPTSDASTPFSVAQASIFDISVVNITGQVTVCVDGGPNVRLWHFTNGAWLDVTTSQTATQTCGLTSSFSPFASAPSASVALVSSAAVDAAAKAAAEAAAAKREAEKQSARAEITTKLQSAKDLTPESFAKAEIPGITATNIAAVQAELLALPETARTDINQVLKVAHKYELVGNIGSDQIRFMQSNSFVEIGLIPADSKNKVALVAAIRKLPASSRDTYAEIKAAIDAETARIKSRTDRLAAIVARNTTKSTKK